MVVIIVVGDPIADAERDVADDAGLRGFDPVVLELDASFSDLGLERRERASAVRSGSAPAGTPAG